MFRHRTRWNCAVLRGVASGLVAVGLHLLRRHMTAFASRATAFSEFRVEKSRAAATLTLSNGASVRGWFFVASASATHNGPEPVSDILNTEHGFVPFQVDGPDGPRDVLFNPDHIVVAALSDNDEVQRDPGYDIATRRQISMLLSNGQRLSGSVVVHRPKGRDRVSDFARTPGRFKYLVQDQATLLVNVTHVVELLEENPAL